ncbi:MAG: hypothetical protein M1828_005456 [Chrysothrix sp. TS-e1954]|nr:MAG: hypothetical protein M1828_005456 [Chrysothrix sp. TS-e1954]
MPDVKRTIKIKTVQKVIDKDSNVEGFPMRAWHIEIFVQNEHGGADVPANCYDKVVYDLHHTFGDRARQTFKQPPFRCAEEGWGEFDMKITGTVAGKPSENHPLNHDLNFLSEEYEATHKVSFKNPKPELLEILRQSGPVPGDANGVAAGGAAGKDRKRAGGRKSNNVDMEKLADSLTRLTEDDLLHVVHMIHENKSSDTYTKNDVDNGEFHVDLYTLPDGLVKMLWDYAGSGERGAIAA